MISKRADLVERIEALLFAADPMGINIETNTDEYNPEAETITRRLPEAGTVADVQRIVHEEFVRWFSEEDAGRADRFRQISESIWTLWNSGDSAARQAQ